MNESKLVPRRDIPVPQRMLDLKVDSRGYRVPYFVAWFKDGKNVEARQDGAEPDFRVIDPHHFVHCVKDGWCWLCGKPLGVHKTFVVGPMCTINRITSEPPGHLQCMEYGLKVCPFLLNPAMKRNSSDFDKITQAVLAPPGLHDERNPGVMAEWLTRGVAEWKEVRGGILAKLPKPETVTWWTKGRHATYEEAELALVAGLEKLERIATREGSDSLKDLRKLYKQAREFLPRKT